ncbi:MAG: phosphoribosylamine--glycine ligase [Ignavibacteria bacterium]
MKLKVLVIGSGGREDAICHKISKSHLLEKLYCIPGNPGTLRWAENISINISDFYSIKNFCLDRNIDLVVVGPEAPLVEGIADYLEEFGIKVFGPKKFAAQIEGSKSFAKELMKRKNIPTASFRKFTIEQKDEVLRYLQHLKFPVVIKVDGLAAGKGVTICYSYSSSEETIKEIFDQKKFGDAGKIIVVEEFLEGEEFSLFAITDGENYKILTPAQDYKRIGDNDTGKNTGGMGSYSFIELLSSSEIEEIKTKIIEPVLEGLKEIGHPYIGCLYCGLIKTNDEIKVIEFNCRFGDPETQAVLHTIHSDLLELLWQTVNKKVDEYKLEIEGRAICLVLASNGYPEKFKIGYEITGLDEINNEELFIYHAGTKFFDDKIITNGGRVLSIVAFSNKKPFYDLIKKVYNAANKINFENKYFRKDIGLKGLKKLKIE